MEHFYQNLEGENWFDYADFYRDMVNGASNGSVFIEVGSWKGRSISFLAVEVINSNKKISIHCIDNWSQYGVKDVFLENIKPISSYINVVESISWDAANLYKDNSIDFCFVDADHKYESVKKDILSWLPKVKRGGVLAGHDYNPNVDETNGVYDAIKETIGVWNISLIKNVWIYEKP